MSPVLQIPVFLILTGLLCCARPEKDCHSTVRLESSLEIRFDDTTAGDFMLSPLDANKIWVISGIRQTRYQEIDLRTLVQSPLSAPYQPIFSAYRSYAICQDNFDSLVWIGGNNCNLLKYDKRQKTLTEIPVNYVTRIIPRPERTYFVSFEGLYYWDRASREIEKVGGIPIQFIQYASQPNDSVLLLEKQYTYNFYTGQVAKYNPPAYHTIAENGINLSSRDQAVFLTLNGETRKLPLPHTNLDYTRIWKHFIWQHDSEKLYRYDTKNSELKEFEYHLPDINNYVVSYQYDDEYIWIQRPDQLFFISQKTGNNYRYPIGPREGFHKAIIDDCHVYLLFKNKLIIDSRENFVKSCPVFDPGDYKNALRDFRAFVDSLGVRKEPEIATALKKLRFIKEKYGKTPHEEIAQELKMLETGSFNGVRLKFPEGYEACYNNAELPQAYRNSCMAALIDRYVQSAQFKKAQELNEKLWSTVTASEKDDYNLKTKTDSLNRYLYVIDSIDALDMRADSAAYFRANALFILCTSPWFLGEGCYQYDLAHAALKKFIKKYPSSPLADNAEFSIWETYYCGEGGYDEHSMQDMANQYRRILKKYPGSDIAVDIEYGVFGLLYELAHTTGDSSEYIAWGRDFIKKYTDGRRVEEVKQILQARQ